MRGKQQIKMKQACKNERRAVNVMGGTLLIEKINELLKNMEKMGRNHSLISKTLISVASWVVRIQMVSPDSVGGQEIKHGKECKKDFPMKNQS